MNVKVRKLIESDFEQFKNVLYVFKEAPWSETLSDEEVDEEWNQYKKCELEKQLEKDKIFPNKNYSVFGCFVDNKLVSIVTYTLTYGNDESHKEHGVEFEDNETIAYIFGMATLKKYRGYGYGTKALEATVQYFEYIGVDKSYARYAVDREEIILVNNNYEDVINGNFNYESKSESIHMLKKKGYIEYFEKPGVLYIDNETQGNQKADKKTEDLRAFCVLDHNKKMDLEYSPINKTKVKILHNSLLLSKTV